MTAVSDTGPINYLILIGEIDVLAAIYQRIFLPNLVAEELGRARAPYTVRSWIKNPPSWVNIREPVSRKDNELNHLDAGERDTILLTEELQTSQVIIDDNRGRIEARRRGLPLTGTLGIIQAGSRGGLIDIQLALTRLRRTNFHIHQEVLNQLFGPNIGEL